MKKYFLDKRYKKFTVRVFLILSIVIGVITAVVAGSASDNPDAPWYGLLAIILVWATYFVVKWILKALPTSRE